MFDAFLLRPATVAEAALLFIALVLLDQLAAFMTYVMLRRSWSLRGFILTIGDPPATVPLIILGSVLEEVLFRMPLAVVVAVGNGIPYATVIVMGLLFGLIHAPRSGLFIAIFSQGVGGIIYGFAFLKMGGLQGHPFVALAFTAALHVTFNLTHVGYAKLGRRLE